LYFSFSRGGAPFPLDTHGMGNNRGLLSADPPQGGLQADTSPEGRLLRGIREPTKGKLTIELPIGGLVGLILDNPGPFLGELDFWIYGADVGVRPPTRVVFKIQNLKTTSESRRQESPT
jgi:hypothetical protein